MQLREMRSFLIRLAIGGILLAILIERIGWGAIGQRLAAFRLPFLALLVALILAEVSLRSLNWWLVLRRQGVALRFTRMMYVYMVGNFFGALVPTSVGSDVARSATLAAREGVKVRTSAVLIALLSVVDLASACLLVLVTSSVIIGIPREAVLVAAALLAAAALLHLLLRSRMVIGARWRQSVTHGWLARADRLLHDLSTVSHLSLVAPVFLITVGAQMMSILVAFTVAVAMGQSIPLLYFVAFIPVVNLARVLPVSVARFGGEQLIFVGLFATAGVPSATAFTISLVVALVNSLYLLACGALYLFGSARRVVAPRALRPGSAPRAASAGAPSPAPAGRPPAAPSGGPSAAPSGAPPAAPSGASSAAPSGAPLAQPPGGPAPERSRDKTRRPAG